MARVSLAQAGSTVVLVGVTLLTASGCAGRLAPDAREQFDVRLAEYVQLRNRAVEQAGIGDAVASGAAPVTDVDRLAAAIQQTRRDADQGNFFPPDVAALFRRTIGEQIGAPGGDRILAEISQVRPSQFTPAINARYPDREDPATVPAPLLTALPPLPSVLAYRFVGADLVLLDRATGVIVDVLPGALPTS